MSNEHMIKNGTSAVPQVDARRGAEYWGKEPVFSKNKWTNIECRDWEIDEQYPIDFPEDAMRYLREVKRKGKLCMLCLWNDGHDCVHDNALDEEDDESEECPRCGSTLFSDGKGGVSCVNCAGVGDQ